MSLRTRTLCFVATLTLSLMGCVAEREDDGADTTQISGSDAGVAGDSATVGPMDGGLPSDAEISTIVELQLEAEELGCDDKSIQTLKPSVALEGVVVTATKFDAFTSDDGEVGLDGYYVGDMDAAEWSGIMIVVDRSAATDFPLGAVLDLTGELEEYYCMTQIDVAGYAESDAISPPTPWLVAPQDAGAELYEGMLLKVEEVTVDSQDDFGNSTVNDGLIIGDEFNVYADLSVGETYDVTGVLVMNYGEYKLSPRSLDDIVFSVDFH